MINELTKHSTSADVEEYFNGVLQVSAGGEQFPVNLDQVWMIAYTRKDTAIRSLKENYIENVDYQVFRKNVENSQGGRPEDNYFLSVPCLEFFVARKRREVFEVYRRVFHLVIGANDKIPIMNMQMDFVERSKHILNLDDQSTARLINKVADNLGMAKVDYVGYDGERLCATTLLKSSGSQMNVREFNKRAIELGVLEIKEHTHHDGTVERYKSITPDGSKYGRNYRAVQSTGVTQPLWNVDTFQELIQLMESKSSD